MCKYMEELSAPFCRNTDMIPSRSTVLCRGTFMNCVNYTLDLISLEKLTCLLEEIGALLHAFPLN